MGIATGVGTTTAAAAIAGGIAWAAEVGTDIAAGGTGGNGTVGVPVITGDAPASGVAGTVAAVLRPALNKDTHNAAPTMAKPTIRARSAYRNIRPCRKSTGGAVAISEPKGLPTSPTCTCSTLNIVPNRRRNQTPDCFCHLCRTTTETLAPYG